MEQGGGRAGLRHGVSKSGTKVVGGWDAQWKVLEGAGVVGTCESEFWCCTECNTLPPIHLSLQVPKLSELILTYCYTPCNTTPELRSMTQVCPKTLAEYPLYPQTLILSLELHMPDPPRPSPTLPVPCPFLATLTKAS